MAGEKRQEGEGEEDGHEGLEEEDLDFGQQMAERMEVKLKPKRSVWGSFYIYGLVTAAVSSKGAGEDPFGVVSH